MMKNTTVLLLILLVLVISGCTQESGIGTGRSVQVVGLVFDAYNKPIDYALVDIACKSESGAWDNSTMYTNEFGGFEFGTFESMKYCDLTATFTGISVEKRVFLADMPPVIHFIIPVDIGDFQFANLTGYILDQSLEPIAHAKVEESNNGKFNYTTSKGFFKVSGIRPGRISVIVTATGYNTGIINTEVHNGQTLNLNHSLSRSGSMLGGIKGYVSHSGVPVENATIITLTDNGVISTKSNVRGYYEFRDMGVGNYRIIAYNYSKFPVKADIEVSSGTMTRQDFKLVMDLLGAYVGGFITDEDFNPLYKANNTFTWDGGQSVAQTDMSGYYERGDEFYSHWPAAFDVDIAAKGYITKHDNVTLENRSFYIKNYELKKEINWTSERYV